MLIKMDDGLLNKEDTLNKMGASSNINSARIVVLQDKKKTLEETLAKHKLELRQLCIKEAELTGIMPSEFPLEPGETPPAFRRRIGTSFQLTQSLVNNINNEEESIQNLELEMQVLAKMAEAALGLANEHNVNKTVRRKHMAEYQHLKQKFNALEEKLQFFKTRMSMVQQPKQPSPNINQPPKQKKKPRPLEIDDTVSMNDQFFKTPLRHSLRSLQHPPMQSENAEHRYSVQSHTKLAYRNSDSTSLNENMQYHNNRTPPNQDDPLIHSYLRLSINGYKNYVDRQGSPVPSEAQNVYLHSQSSVNLYNKQQPPMHYPYLSPSQTLPHPHALRRSPQPLPQAHHHQQTQSMQDFTKYNNASPQIATTMLHRQSSPSTSSNSSVKYYPTHATNQMNYRPNSEHTFRTLNPQHQLQPHQQYEQDVMTASTAAGLGGYWKRAENGDMFWCNSASDQNTLPKDKRFGSLDRRKNKRVQKRISPNGTDQPKSAAATPARSNNEPSRTLPSKAQQVVNRHRQNNRQLVRTQSLGSVGGQTVDSVWPSDDNSSCGSESYSEHNKHLRTRKQKEWYETSLDGPPIPETPCVSRSHSTVPSIAPEEKYIDYPSPISPQTPHTPIQMQSPVLVRSPYTPKPMLEIPAESNPSPRVQETNLEIYNNNIPRNGTVVQPAQIKPYYEESKPFEMSDFYKYSTKYKKSPIKSPPEENIRTRTQSIGFRNLYSPQSGQSVNLNDNYDDDNASVSQKSSYQPLQPMKCKPFSPITTSTNSNNSNMTMVSPSNSLNMSLELSSPNVAENFSAEMNAWYQNHENQTDNNNATLV